NLGVLMRKLFGVGTPRSLQGGSGALCAGLLALPAFLSTRLRRTRPRFAGAPKWNPPRPVGCRSVAA
ncbi:MAG: hypothetical protein D6744_13290, partial [Planctomycetota bacterium]